jgi:signal peptidase I
LLGDNRPVSEDSRVFGPVPVENIVGKAWFGFWPMDRWAFLDRIGSQVAS